MGLILSCCPQTSTQRTKYAATTPDQDTSVSLHGSEPVLCIGMSPWGVVSGGDGGHVVVHDHMTGDVIRRWTEHTRGVNSIAISRHFIFSGSRDKTIKKWTIDTDTAHYTLAGHELVVTALSVSPDQKCLVSGSRDATVRIWDVDKGECVRTIKVIRNLVTGLSWMKNSLVLQSSEDLRLRIWDTVTGDVVGVMEDSSLRNIPLSCEVVGDRALIAHNGFDGSGCEVVEWNLKDKSVDRVLRGHKQAVYGAVSVADKWIVSCSKDGEIRVWLSDCVGCTSVIGPVLCLCDVSSVDEPAVACGLFDGSIRVLMVPSLKIQGFK